MAITKSEFIRYAYTIVILWLNRCINKCLSCVCSFEACTRIWNTLLHSQIAVANSVNTIISQYIHQFQRNRNKAKTYKNTLKTGNRLTAQNVKHKNQQKHESENQRKTKYLRDFAYQQNEINKSVAFILEWLCEQMHYTQVALL